MKSFIIKVSLWVLVGLFGGGAICKVQSEPMTLDKVAISSVLGPIMVFPALPIVLGSHYSHVCIWNCPKDHQDKNIVPAVVKHK